MESSIIHLYGWCHIIQPDQPHHSLQSFWLYKVKTESQIYRLLSSFPVLRLMLSLSALTAAVGLLLVPLLVHARCRNQPGSSGYPSAAGWSALNDSIDGRLVNVVPSAKACVTLGCTEAQWESGVFRQTIPGSMNAVGYQNLHLSFLLTYGPS
jgi:hypothetical protein